MAKNESTSLTQFNSLGLAESVLRALTYEGYTTPTPIQTQAIPALLDGKDILGIAQTGTGKTAAFVLPLIDALAKKTMVKPQPKTCKAVIIAPTRELVGQIADGVRRYGRFVKPSLAVVVGGVKPGPQVRALAPGVDIVVATPGRLLDHMSSGVVSLEQTEVVVLDEADQMLDLGFLPAIRKIMSHTSGRRQTVLLSATMPRQIEGLARDFLSDPATISVAPASQPIERIAQSVVHVPGQAKRGVLTALLRDEAVDRAIVFTRTKRGADRVSQNLEKSGLSAAAIHGNKTQGQRERALAAFKRGRVSILVATDIAARGIDIDDVSHVVNYELPNVPEAYVHRIGRTARAGKSGVAVSLCDPGERKLLRDIERLIGNAISVASAPEGTAEQAQDWTPHKGAQSTGVDGGKTKHHHRSGASGKPHVGKRSGAKSTASGPKEKRAYHPSASSDHALSTKHHGYDPHIGPISPVAVPSDRDRTGSAEPTSGQSAHAPSATNRPRRKQGGAKAKLSRGPRRAGTRPDTPQHFDGSGDRSSKRRPSHKKGGGSRHLSSQGQRAS